MQDIAGINDNPVEYRINRVHPFKQHIAAVCIFSRRRAKSFHVAIQGSSVIAPVIVVYFFIAGRSVPIERSSGIGAIEKINDGSEHAWIGGIILRDSLQRHQVCAAFVDDGKEAGIGMYMAALLQYSLPVQLTSEPCLKKAGEFCR